MKRLLYQIWFFILVMGLSVSLFGFAVMAEGNNEMANEIVKNVIEENEDSFAVIFNLREFRRFVLYGGEEPLKVYNQSFLKKMSESNREKKHEMAQKKTDLVFIFQEKFSEKAYKCKLNMPKHNELIFNSQKIHKALEDKYFNWVTVEESQKLKEQRVRERPLRRKKRLKKWLEERGGVRWWDVGRYYFSFFVNIIVYLFYASVLALIFSKLTRYEFKKLFIWIYCVGLGLSFIYYSIRFVYFWWELLYIQWFG